MYTKIAHAIPPFEGKPMINAPAVYGAASKKPFLWRLPVTGERPMVFTAESLPTGLSIDTASGIISGAVESDGEYEITVSAQNSCGTAAKKIKLMIGKNMVCRTPLLGWTSWNAFMQHVSHEKITDVARILVETGLADHGFQYVNIDSGWQGLYGGEHYAVMASPLFPDMKATVDKIHSYGLKAGIYSTPMQKAWGGTEAPGCTTDWLDPRYNNTYFGIGVTHREAANVAQWCDWGFDYLKYDWSPSDLDNAKLMKDALEDSPRDFAFCVTTSATWEGREWWAKNCTSWRANCDSADNWPNLLSRFESGAEKWQEFVNPGHYFDQDMLELGTIISGPCRLTPDEQIVSFTIRVIFPSPIQLSCDLTKLTEFELDMFSNEEVLAVNQDELGANAVCIDHHIHNTTDGETTTSLFTKLYVKPLADGSYAAAFFNLGECEAVMELPEKYGTHARDLWSKEDLPYSNNALSFTLPPHTVKLLKVTK